MTVARTLSDTFAGIAPSSVTDFVLTHCYGAWSATLVVRGLFPAMAHQSADAYNGVAG